MAGMKDTLTLRYSGPLVDEGRMDAYETAACIMAFADFLGVAAQAAHGPQARIKTEVRAFSHGSFRRSVCPQLCRRDGHFVCWRQHPKGHL